MVCMSHFVRLYCHNILIISNHSFILCSDLLKIYDLKINKGFCLVMFDLLIHKLMFSVYQYILYTLIYPPFYNSCYEK